MPSLHDTRVLENLIRAEKTAEASFKAYTKDAASAASALSAWSVADSGDTQDLMDVSIRISQLIAAVTESQRAYTQALHTYRVSLNDVLTREQALRTVVRDREILVGKLMKLGNKKPSDNALQSHQAKLDDAQRELNACETFLQDEEIALSHAKRQSFRVALAERIASLGELGRVMDDSAHKAHDLLTSLGQSEDFEAHHFEPQDREALGDDGSTAGDSVTPSHSASQAMSRASSSSSLDEQAAAQAGRASSRAQQNGSTSIVRAASPRRAMSNHRAMSPISSAAPPDRLVSRQSTIRAPPPAPRPVLGPVPTAPRPVSSYLAEESGSLLPSFDIPKAPANVSSRRPTDDSSDEEDARDFVAHQSGVPRAQRSSHYPYDAPTSPTSPARGGGVRLRRRADSDTSSVIGASSGKRRGSFFGSLASLFKKKDRRVDDSAARSAVMGGSSWDTRIDRNVFAAQKGASGGGGAGRTASIAPSRLRPGNDSSDEEPNPKNLVRVVNNPKARVKAMSDLGRTKTPSIHTVTTETTKKKKVKRASKAASDVGFISPSTLPIHRGGPSFLAPPVPAVPASAVASTPGEETPSIKKKKKAAAPKDGPATIVLSAEKLGIPPAAGTTTTARPSKLSRSNTVTSHATVATTATGATKKKKKKDTAAAAAEGVPTSATNVVAPPLPTAADLASTLPSARGSVYDSLTVTLPLPLPNGAARPSSPGLTEGGPAGKVPKALAENEKRSKKEQARYSNANWVSHPTTAKKAGHVGEGEESLMSVVDRAEAQAVAEPSRKYGTSTTEGGATARAPLPTSGTTTSLTKRKSVRLAEGDAGQPQQALSSPASSIRSDHGAPPRHGILVNHSLSPAQALLNADSAANGGASDVGSGTAAAGWSTRVSSTRTLDDSSDDDDDAVAYKQARKAFVKAGKAKEVV